MNLFFRLISYFEFSKKKTYEETAKSAYKIVYYMYIVHTRVNLYCRESSAEVVLIEFDECACILLLIHISKMTQKKIRNEL